MSSASGIRAGRAFVELFADNTKLVRGLRLAEAKIKAFGGKIRAMGLQIAGIGTALLTPFVGASKYFSSYGDQVAKMAKRTGLSVETLSELRFVASQTGSEFESMEMAFRKMQRSIYDAGRGLSTAVDALADLGLTFKDLDGLSPENQFKLLAERIKQVEDPTKKAAIAMSLFGRTGTNLLPMFAQGAKGIDALQEEARRLGLTMSKEDAQDAEDFTDAMDALWKVIKMGVFRVGAALAPLLKQIAERLTDIAIQISGWINANRALVVTVVKVIAAVTAGGMALVVLGTLISGVGVAIGQVAGAIQLAGGAFKAMATLVMALFSPLGLLTGAVLGLGGYLLYTSGEGGKALAWLGERFGQLRDTALKSISGISDALAAGDIGLAAKILWLSLKLAWQQGIDPLKKLWAEFVFGFKALFFTLKYEVVNVWLDLVNTLKQAWAGFQKWHAGTVETGANWMAKRMMEVRGLFDESFDVEFAKQSIDEQSDQRRGEIDEEYQARAAANEDEYQTAKKANDAAHVQNMQGIVAENAERVRGIQEALDASKKQWQDALEQARAKREAHEADGGPAPMKGLDAALLSAIEGLDDQIQKQAEFSVRGTFNASAILSLQGGNDSTAERTAQATAETAKNTKRLLQQSQRTNLPTFA